MSQAEVFTANPIDVHVGTRVRIRRRLLGLSQQQLADSLDLTFQQIQKYERGANRISASKLYAMAKALQTPVSYFFEGLEDPTLGAASETTIGATALTVQSFLHTPEGLELAEIFPRLGRGRVRRQVLDLVRAMALEAPALA